MYTFNILIFGDVYTNISINIEILHVNSSKKIFNTKDMGLNKKHLNDKVYITDVKIIKN